MVMIMVYVITLYCVGISSVLMFGADLTPNLLDNIGSRSGGLSLFVRTIYCAILFFHLPLYFFTIKEYSLVIYDEYYNKSISNEFDRQVRESV